MLFSCSLGYWEDLANQSVGNMVKQLRVQQPQPDSSCDFGDLRGSEVGANPWWAAGRPSKRLVSLQFSSPGQPLVVVSFVLCSGAKVVLSFLSLFCSRLLGSPQYMWDKGLR